jgi:hypothetical protein
MARNCSRLPAIALAPSSLMGKLEGQFAGLKGEQGNYCLAILGHGDVKGEAGDRHRCIAHGGIILSASRR